MVLAHSFSDISCLSLTVGLYSLFSRDWKTPPAVIGMQWWDASLGILQNILLLAPILSTQQAPFTLVFLVSPANNSWCLLLAPLCY